MVGEEGPIIVTKRRRHTPAQIRRKLAEGQERMAKGCTVSEVCSDFGITETIWVRWVTKHGDTKANDARRIQKLEAENARLKEQLADAELDKAMLKHLVEEDW